MKKEEMRREMFNELVTNNCVNKYLRTQNAILYMGKEDNFDDGNCTYLIRSAKMELLALDSNPGEKAFDFINRTYPSLLDGMEEFLRTS